MIPVRQRGAWSRVWQAWAALGEEGAALIRLAEERAAEGGEIAAAPIARRAAELLEGRGDLPAALLTRSIEAEAWGAAEPGERAVALVAAADAARRGVEPARAEPWLDEALPLARQAGRPVLLARGLVVLGDWRLIYADAPAALAAYREALETLVAAGEPPGTRDLRLRGQLGLAEALLIVGQNAAFLRTIDVCAMALGGEEDPEIWGRGRALVLLSQLVRGVEVDEAEWDEALGALAAVGAYRSQWRLALARAGACHISGRLEEARAGYQQARGIAEVAGDPSGLGPAWLGEAEVCVAMGHLIEADDAARRALEVVQATGDRVGLRLCLERTIELAALLGASRLAVEHMRLLARLAGEDGERGQEARLLVRVLHTILVTDQGGAADAVDHLVAVLGEDAAELLTAAELLEAAVDVETAGCPEDARELAVAAARVEFAAKRPDEAVRALAEAAHVASRAGERELAIEMLAEAVRLGETFVLDHTDRWRRERDALIWER